MGKKKSPKTDSSVESTVPVESKASKRQKPKPPAPLLDLVNDFLTQYPLEGAAHRLVRDIERTGGVNQAKRETWKGASKNLPSLVELYKEWVDMQLQRIQSGAGSRSVPKKSTMDVRHHRSSSESDSESIPASSSTASSSEDSSSEDNASEASVKITRAKAARPTTNASSIPVSANKLKRKRPSAFTALTSSSSSAQDSSSSDDSEAETASSGPKRRKTGRRKNRVKSKSSSSAAASSASEESDSKVNALSISGETPSSSDGDSSESEAVAAATSDKESGRSDSDTSATSSSSDESSDSEPDTQATSKTVQTHSKETADTEEDTSSYTSSSSGGQSSSESEAESPPEPMPKATKKTNSRTDKPTTHQNESTESSVTLTASTPVEKPAVPASSSSSGPKISSSKLPMKDVVKVRRKYCAKRNFTFEPAGGADDNLKRQVTQKYCAKRKRSPLEPAGGADDSLKRQKTINTPFTRVPRDIAVDPKFASNKYVPYDYAEKAHRDLIVTKGKGFTKEKNKKKRGSYRGGAISMEPKGIKFDD